MTTYGLTATGFVAKSLTDVKAEYDAAYKAGPLGAAAGTEPDGSIPPASLAGQMISIDTDAAAGLWDLAQLVYKSFDPESATDEAQDSLCALTGTLRDAAVASIVVACCTGTINTIIPLGSVVTVITAGTRFASKAQQTIAAATAWATSHTYALGDRVKTGTTTVRIYQCITAGMSAGAGTGPSGTGTNITDNVAHWRYLGDGDGWVDVTFEAEDTGELAAPAWTLTEIATPVGGWENVTNPLDATQGSARESNSELRIRREAELPGDGGGPADSIRSKILRIAEGSGDPIRLITSCRVFVNDTDATDSNGLPPHSVMCLVLGGVNLEIAETIWDAVGAGIATHGTITTSITDSAGNTQSVSFSRPTPVPIYIDVALTYDVEEWPVAGGEDQVKAALEYYGADFPIGKSVRSSPLEAAVIEGPAGAQADETPNPHVPGILEVTHLYISTAPTPTVPTTIPITATQLATFDTANMTVTATPGTP